MKFVWQISYLLQTVHIWVLIYCQKFNFSLKHAHSLNKYQFLMQNSEKGWKNSGSQTCNLLATDRFFWVCFFFQLNLLPAYSLCMQGIMNYHVWSFKLVLAILVIVASVLQQLQRLTDVNLFCYCFRWYMVSSILVYQFCKHA